MRNAKQLCKERGLYAHMSVKGAEVMAQAVAEDILHILQTSSVRPIHERIFEYINIQPREAEEADSHEELRLQHKYQLP